MKFSVQRNFLKVAGVAMLVTGCGGGGGGAGDNSSTGSLPPATGGSSKTVFVTGAIAGFGSVIVNGVRYDTDSAQVEIEDRPGAVSELRVGEVIRLVAEVDSQGIPRAKTISQDHLIQGVVQAVDVAAGTLTIAGQVISVDNETSFDDSIPLRSLAGIAVGDRIEVHGFASAGGMARATRIEKAGAGDTEVEVTGKVTGANATTRRFNVGSLVVDYATAVLEGFGAASPVDGDLVEVKGTTYLGDGALRATKVEKEDDDFDGLSGDESEVEGLVTRFASSSDFDVAGQKVTTTSATSYLNGTAADLKVDAKVEVEGKLDASGTLVAAKVAFKRSSPVRLSARVDEVNVDAGTLRALGVTVAVSAATRKEDHEGDDFYFGLDDVSVGDWVEVAGYADPAGTGKLIATRLERDEPEEEVELRGPASDVQAASLRVFGVLVDLLPGTEFEENDVSIGASEFVARAPGRIVDVEGSWNGSSLAADQAEIENGDGGTSAPPVVQPPPTTPPPMPPPPVTPPPTTPPPAIDGAALYDANCKGCHGSISGIFSANAKSATKIQDAIDANKGGMGRLSTLTPAEVQAIAAAVAAANP
jgi:hypothetical protein